MEFENTAHCAVLHCVLVHCVTRALSQAIETDFLHRKRCAKALPHKRAVAPPVTAELTPHCLDVPVMADLSQEQSVIVDAQYLNSQLCAEALKESVDQGLTPVFFA